MFYVLMYGILQDDEGGYFEVNDGVDFEGVKSWSLGQKFDAVLPNPIVVEIDPVGDYEGLPADMYNTHMCLMSDDLVDVLRQVGVDNTDTYPALLRNSKTSETYSYQAVNIIGLVAAADLAKSNWSSYDGDAMFDTSFEGLTIDHKKAKNMLMFRLAESTTTIIVHQRVKDALEQAAFESLIFTKPEEFVHV